MATDQHHLIKIAVYALLVRDGNVLMARRKNTGFMDGMLGIPAGHLEANESLKQGMIREAQEEIAVTIQESDADLVFVGHRYNAETNNDYVDCYFKVSKWVGTPKINESDKASDISWLPLDNLPDDVIEYNRVNLEKWQRGENYYAKVREDS